MFSQQHGAVTYLSTAPGGKPRGQQLWREVWWKGAAVSVLSGHFDAFCSTPEISTRTASGWYPWRASNAWGKTAECGTRSRSRW